MSKPSKDLKRRGLALGDIVVLERDQAFRFHISRPRSKMPLAPERRDSDPGTPDLGFNDVIPMSITYLS